MSATTAMRNVDTLTKIADDTTVLAAAIASLSDVDCAVALAIAARRLAGFTHPHQWEDCPCGHHHDDHSVTEDLTVGCTGCLIAARNGVEPASPPRRKTGVILGLHADTRPDNVLSVADAVQERFPEIKVAVITGAQSVAFEYDEVEQ